MADVDYAAELILVNAAIAANLKRMGAAELTDRSRRLVQQSLDELRRHRDAVASKLDRKSAGMIVQGVAEKQG